MAFSKLSKTVNTEIIENMPMVIPSKDKNVRTLLTANALVANKRLSIINLTVFNYDVFPVFQNS